MIVCSRRWHPERVSDKPSPGEIDGGVRRERERGDRHPVDLARGDLDVCERGDDRVADEGMCRLSRPRPARVGLLSYADDCGIRGMIWSERALRGRGPDVSLTVIARESGRSSNGRSSVGVHSLEARTMLT